MILEVCLLLAPQTFTDDAWFRLHPAESTRTNSRFIVSGSRRAAVAEEALRRLARLMNWEFPTPSAAVRKQIAPVILDLAFSRQDPRSVAQLIAAAAGVEAALVRVGRRVELRLVVPSATSTDAIRTRAVDWYRSLLADPTVTGESRVAALTGLGDALVDAGEDRAAIEVFQRVFEQDDTGRFVEAALFAATRAHYRLAKRADRLEFQRRSDLQLAEQTARRVLQHRNPKFRAPTVLLLGRILVTAGRDLDCIELLEAERARLVDTPEHTDIQLLVASCYARAEEPGRALATLDSLVRPKEAARTWTRSQWQEYHLLRGTSAEVLSRGAIDRIADLRLADAMRSLEWFLGAGGETAQRRHIALLALGRVYLAKGKYVDARATVLRLLEAEELDAEHLQDIRILEACTMTVLGFGEHARDRLELAVRANPDGLPRVVEYLRRGSGGNIGRGSGGVRDDMSGRSDRARRAVDSGRFEDALRELAPVESDPDAELADLFLLARCYEGLHLRARREPSVPDESAARHLERAQDLFDRIERRNVVRGKDGKSTPGPWAIAARSACAMMRWTDDSPSWSPPRIAATPK